MPIIPIQRLFKYFSSVQTKQNKFSATLRTHKKKKKKKSKHLLYCILRTVSFGLYTHTQNPWFFWLSLILPWVKYNTNKVNLGDECIQFSSVIDVRPWPPPFMWFKVCLFMQQGRPINPLFISNGSPYLPPSPFHFLSLSSPRSRGQVITGLVLPPIPEILNKRWLLLLSYNWFLLSSEQGAVCFMRTLWRWQRSDADGDAGGWRCPQACPLALCVPARQIRQS